MQTVLRNRSFRSLALGRLVTNAGDSLYAVAAMWLVWELSRSPGMTAVAGFLTRLPSVLQLFAGPLVDRVPLGRLLVATQLLQAVFVLVVPAAAYLDRLTVWLVLAVMPLLALCNQLAYPAQSAAVPRLVEKHQLVSANSVLATAYQGADLVFNALAGVLVAAVGAVALYLVDSVTFLVAALLFLSIRIPAAAAPECDGRDAAESTAATASTDGGAPVDGGTSDADTDDGFLARYLTDLREGVDYLRGTILLPLLGGAVVTNFAIAATVPVLPAFSDSMGGAATYGALMAAVAGGSLVGSLLASPLSRQPYGRLSIGAFLAGGSCWIGSVLAQGAVATVLLFGLAAVPIGVTNVMAGAMVQSLVPEALMGRVSAVATSLTVAMTPAGALAGGAVAESLGVDAAVAMGGVGLLFIAAYVFALPSLRRLPAVGEMETLRVD